MSVSVAECVLTTFLMFFVLTIAARQNALIPSLQVRIKSRHVQSMYALCFVSIGNN